jgi:hypothetical protein
METFKDIAPGVSALIAAFAAVTAIWTYRENSKNERAKWAVQLFEKFFESEKYRGWRERLDCDADSHEIRAEVDKEGTEFTDYLNFFEMVLYLLDSGRLEENDVLSLFQYYLTCLKRQTSVMAYLNNKGKGFERLRAFLNRQEL